MVFGDNPSGRNPSSETTRILSPANNLWADLSVNTLFVILLIKPVRFTSYSLLEISPSVPSGFFILIWALYVLLPIDICNKSSVFAPTLYPAITWVGGVESSVNPSKYIFDGEDETPTVFSTFIDSHSIDIFFLNWLSGGITWVIYPLLSLLNAAGLNPFAFNATAPKLELELVIDKSPPSELVKCSLKPTAKIDTAWIYPSLDTLMWVFL